MEDLRKELFIDDSSYHKLNQAFKEHSSRHFYWVTLAAKAAKEVSELKLKLKILEAELSEQYRQEYAEQHGKLPAVSFDIRKEVLPLKDEWKDLNKNLIEAYENLEILRGAVDSFAERGYLLKEVAKYSEAALAPNIKYQSEAQKMEKEAETLDMGMEE